MVPENLDVYSSLFDAMKEDVPINKARRARAKPAISKVDAELLYTIQVNGPHSIEMLARESGFALEQILPSLTALMEKGYVAVSELNGRNVFDVTSAGKSLTLGEM